MLYFFICLLLLTLYFPQADVHAVISGSNLHNQYAGENFIKEIHDDINYMNGAEKLPHLNAAVSAQVRTGDSSDGLGNRSYVSTSNISFPAQIVFVKADSKNADLNFKSELSSKPSVPWSYYNTAGRKHKEDTHPDSSNIPRLDHTISVGMNHVLQEFTMEKTQPSCVVQEEKGTGTVNENGIMNQKHIQNEGPENLRIRSDSLPVPIIPFASYPNSPPTKSARKEKGRPAVPWSYYNTVAKSHISNDKKQTSQAKDSNKQVLNDKASVHSIVSDYPDTLQF